ncbi:unnamed protein product [Cercospora beticola]|nr:unnamed protein product [Cercospora beticola]
MPSAPDMAAPEPANAATGSNLWLPARWPGTVPHFAFPHASTCEPSRGQTSWHTPPVGQSPSRVYSCPPPPKPIFRVQREAHLMESIPFPLRQRRRGRYLQREFCGPAGGDPVRGGRLLMAPARRNALADLAGADTTMQSAEAKYRG